MYQPKEEMDNPFRPGGELSQEADEIVSLIKQGKPITPAASPVQDDDTIDANLVLKKKTQISQNSEKQEPEEDEKTKKARLKKEASKAKKAAKEARKAEKRLSKASNGSTCKVGDLNASPYTDNQQVDLSQVKLLEESQPQFAQTVILPEDDEKHKRKCCGGKCCCSKCSLL